MHVVTMADDLSLTICLARDGVWEEHVGSLLRHLLHPGQRAAEGGANIGIHTLTIAESIGPAGTLDSFEALPDFHPLLSTNLVSNGLQGQVRLHQLALWHEEAELNFLQDVNHRGSGHVSQVEPHGEYARTVTARATTLDAALAGTPPFDLLRLDIEGAEVMALRGARQTIERSPALRIVMEWLPQLLRSHGEPMEEMRSLAAMGFRPWRIGQRPPNRPLGRRFSLEPLEMEALANLHHEDILLSRQDPG